MDDVEIERLVAPYASEATRLLMHGYVNRMLTSDEIYRTIKAALGMLAEHLTKGEKP